MIFKLRTTGGKYTGWFYNEKIGEICEKRWLYALSIYFFLYLFDSLVNPQTKQLQRLKAVDSVGNCIVVVSIFQFTV